MGVYNLQEVIVNANVGMMNKLPDMSGMNTQEKLDVAYALATQLREACEDLMLPVENNNLLNNLDKSQK